MNEEGKTGKYDELAEKVRQETGALGVSIFIHGEGRGEYFSTTVPREAFGVLADSFETLAKLLRIGQMRVPPPKRKSAL